MKKLLIIFICGTVFIVGAIGVVIWLSWQPQEWYSPPDYSLHEVKTLADRSEYRLNEEFHKVRPSSDVWLIRITEEAMNAWLSGRLEGWLTHDQEIELPPEIMKPQVHITPEGIWFAAMIQIEENYFRPVAILLWVDIKNSSATIFPVAIRLGKLPIPLSIFEEIIQDAKMRVDELEPIVPLMDDREVEIQDVAFEEGSVVLTCKTYLPK